MPGWGGVSDRHEERRKATSEVGNIKEIFRCRRESSGAASEKVEEVAVDAIGANRNAEFRAPLPANHIPQPRTFVTVKPECSKRL